MLITGLTHRGIRPTLEAKNMKQAAWMQLPKSTMSRLGRWLDHKLFKIDVYVLRGDEVVPSRHWLPRFKTQDVATWQQVFISFGVPLIIITFGDGRTVELSDKNEDLLRILKRVVPNKELPWKAL